MALRSTQWSLETHSLALLSNSTVIRSSGAGYSGPTATRSTTRTRSSQDRCCVSRSRRETPESLGGIGTRVVDRGLGLAHEHVYSAQARATGQRSQRSASPPRWLRSRTSRRGWSDTEAAGNDYRRLAVYGLGGVEA